MKKFILLMCFYFLLLNSACNCSSFTHGDLSFFLGQYFLSKKDYKYSMFYFDQVRQQKHLKRHVKVYDNILLFILGKDKIFIEKIKIKHKKSKRELLKLKNLYRFYLSLYDYKESRDPVLAIFNKYCYNYDKMKRSRHHFRKIASNIRHINLVKMKNSYKYEKKERNSLLIKQFLDRRAYFSIINRARFVTFNLTKHDDYRYIFWTLKSCNELFLDSYVNKVVNGLYKSNNTYSCYFK